MSRSKYGGILAESDIYEGVLRFHPMTDRQSEDINLNFYPPQINPQTASLVLIFL